MSALDLCDAAAQCAVDRLEQLLAAGVDPNARPNDANPSLSEVDEDWASSDKSSQPLIFFDARSEWHALRLAAEDGTYPKKPDMARMLTALLRQGADPYAQFRQPLPLYCVVYRFPGHDADEECDDEDIDLMKLERARRMLEQCQKERQSHAGADDGKEEEEDYDPFDDHDTGDYDIAMFYDAEYPRKYGVRSVTHSMLEDSAFVQPVLDFLGDNLDLEY
ncbi:hypothetical protein VTN00DRAFT_3303 [Thermoascus crustaceus]|uniref:uncharacterized protein n=1 Tax=Thermoascus crustaceus TaxID=5088 RepID=UPI0037424975